MMLYPKNKNAKIIINLILLSDLIIQDINYVIKFKRYDFISVVAQKSKTKRR